MITWLLLFVENVIIRKSIQVHIKRNLPDFANTTDPNTALNEWSQQFVNVINANAPVRHKRLERVKQPEWLNEEILCAIKQKLKYSKTYTQQSKKL